MKKIAVFVSGGGSNFIAIHRQIIQGNILGKIVMVFSNNPNCGAIKFAEENSIPIFIINAARYPNAHTRDEFLLETCLKAEIDLICLAGFMKMLPQNIVKQYEYRILNIHPGLLPEFGGKGFYGTRVHEAVINTGKRESGATVHFVDEIYDHGPIILQKKVEVMETDTPESLAARVLKLEHELFPEVVKAFCENKIIMENNKPKILEYNEN
ncbi:MAG TPA: phosphoribosylglycinamide formyltransferase [Candidatus Marinimicrobia bacterium]|jgi:formyltetrahydrofolate-dependent phosphoribosylglycinamide formyltransferase|nr:phosphoribosylglycinamide formyltransferase [Candidatus Neomarinimicrobiota bacterium]|tara:strand:- start:1465 stop:2097 length:633 start_codon:yes stop_codon:yes gene_type:complete